MPNRLGVRENSITKFGEESFSGCITFKPTDSGILLDGTLLNFQSATEGFSGKVPTATNIITAIDKCFQRCTAKSGGPHKDYSNAFGFDLLPAFDKVADEFIPFSTYQSV